MSEERVLLVTVEKAARRLGVGRSTAYPLIACGELERIRIGRCARIPVDSIVVYVERQRQVQAPATSNPAAAAAVSACWPGMI